jgi:glycosyltransferase involved in cell wall biosynthesis
VKVCILSVQIPFITGGAESLALALKRELKVRRVDAEILLLPFKWYPPEELLNCMLVSRLIDVTEVNGIKIDRLITLKFPAYYVPHPRKVCWLLHQHRQAYDLYGTALSDLSPNGTGRAVAAEINRWDRSFLPDHSAIFTISKRVTERLRRYNEIESTPLYPPLDDERFSLGRFDNYILYPGRFDTIKRQHLLFDAFTKIPGDLQLVFCGQSDSAYASELIGRIDASPIRSRVRVLGQVSENEKKELYANCLAVYNGVFDEDYGYVTLEAFCASKPVITHTDSGGPLEFVVDGYNGYVIEPDPAQLAVCLKLLAEKPAHARRLGSNGYATLKSHNISWDNVIQRLLS